MKRGMAPALGGLMSWWGTYTSTETPQQFQGSLGYEGHLGLPETRYCVKLL